MAADSDKCIRRMVAYLHVVAGKQQLLATASVAFTFQVQQKRADADRGELELDDSEALSQLLHVNRWVHSAMICSQHYTQRRWVSGSVLRKADKPDSRESELMFNLDFPLSFDSTQQILLQGHAEFAACDGLDVSMPVIQRDLKWHPSSFSSAVIIDSKTIGNIGLACRCGSRRKRRGRPPADHSRDRKRKDPKPKQSDDSDSDKSDGSSLDSDSEADSDASLLEALAAELNRGRANDSDVEESTDDPGTGTGAADPSDHTKIDELAQAVASSKKYRGDRGATATAVHVGPIGPGAQRVPSVPSDHVTGNPGAVGSPVDGSRRLFKPRSEDTSLDSVGTVDVIQSRMTSRSVKEAVRTVKSKAASSSSSSSRARLPTLASPGVFERPEAAEAAGNQVVPFLPQDALVASLDEAQANNAGLLAVEEVAEEGLLALASFPPAPLTDGAVEAVDLAAAQHLEKHQARVKHWATQAGQTVVAFAAFDGAFFTDWSSLPDTMFRRISLVQFLEELDVCDSDRDLVLSSRSGCVHHAAVVGVVGCALALVSETYSLDV